jgi:hypothetical protein
MVHSSPDHTLETYKQVKLYLVNKGHHLSNTVVWPSLFTKYVHLKFLKGQVICRLVSHHTQNNTLWSYVEYSHHKLSHFPIMWCALLYYTAKHKSEVGREQEHSLWLAPLFIPLQGHCNLHHTFTQDRAASYRD